MRKIMVATLLAGMLSLGAVQGAKAEGVLPPRGTYPASGAVRQGQPYGHTASRNHRDRDRNSWQAQQQSQVRSRQADRDDDQGNWNQSDRSYQGARGDYDARTSGNYQAPQRSRQDTHHEGASRSGQWHGQR